MARLMASIDTEHALVTLPGASKAIAVAITAGLALRDEDGNVQRHHFYLLPPAMSVKGAVVDMVTHVHGVTKQKVLADGLSPDVVTLLLQDFIGARTVWGKDVVKDGQLLGLGIANFKDICQHPMLKAASTHLSLRSFSQWLLGDISVTFRANGQHSALEDAETGLAIVERLEHLQEHGLALPFWQVVPWLTAAEWSLRISTFEPVHVLQKLAEDYCVRPAEEDPAEDVLAHYTVRWRNTYQFAGSPHVGVAACQTKGAAKCQAARDLLAVLARDPQWRRHIHP